MAKRGAKNKYETNVKPYLSKVNEWVKNGIIEEEIAKALNISVASLNNYRNQYPEFKKALSEGKGANVLQRLVNAGIESAIGGYRENVTTVIIIDENGKPSKRQKTINKVYYPPNASLNRYYTQIYGKDQGFTNDPLEYDLKKAKLELDQAIEKAKNWDIDLKD